MPALRHWILAAAVAAAALALTPAPATAQAASGAGARASDHPRPAKPRAPVDTAEKKTPPGTDPRQVRPAEALPPERVQASSPRRGPGAGAPDAGPQNDPRGVEERRDPEP